MAGGFTETGTGGQGGGGIFVVCWGGVETGN